jgi:Ca2+-binding RTX toxin-like protein
MRVQVKASLPLMTLAILGFMALGQGTARAATLVVDDDGVECPAAAFTTIQAAVSAAAPGDTIDVCAGTYPETVIVNKQVTILGAQSGVDARTRAVAETSESVVTGGMSLGANNVVVDGFLFRDTPYLPTLGGAAVYTSPDFSGYNVRNNIFRSNIFGLYLNSQGSAQTIVRHSFFDHNTQEGPGNGNAIYSDQGAHNVLVDENRFEGHFNAAMVFDRILPSDPNTLLIISDNASVDDRTLLALFRTTNADVLNNTFDGPDVEASRGSGILIGGSDTDVLIDGNVVTQATSGIRVANFAEAASTMVTVTDNSLTANDYGIRIANGGMSGQLEAHLNSITDNVTAGIQNDDTDPSEMVDAEKNWWGDPFGPSLQGPGSGDPVSLNVDFDPWCFNAQCTVFGIGGATSGDDTITGTSGNDVIYGGPGDDTIFGLGGNDQLFGEGGDDRLEGGSGNDVLDGGDHDDVILGGSGSDTATGGAGADEIRGGSGNDTLRGGSGRDEIFGGSGNDRLYGERGPDLVDGGDGNDFISGGSGNDRLQARDGQTDTVRGGTGSDTAEVDRRDNVSGVERRI